MAAICAAAPSALVSQLPLPTIVQRAGRGIAAVSSAKNPTYTFFQLAYSEVNSPTSRALVVGSADNRQ